MLKLTVEGGAVLLWVKVVPGASSTRCLGEWENRAKIAVAAPAEKGKANQALLAFLAKRLGIRKRDVTVVSGHAAPLKVIRIEGVSPASLAAALIR